MPVRNASPAWSAWRAALCAVLLGVAAPAADAQAGAPGQAPSGVTLRCSVGGDVLVSGATASGSIVAGAVGSPDTSARAGQRSATQICTWVVGSLGAHTTIFDVAADGDPTSSALYLFGAFEARPFPVLRAIPIGRPPKDSALVTGPSLTGGTAGTTDGPTADPATLVVRLQGCVRPVA